VGSKIDVCDLHVLITGHSKLLELFRSTYLTHDTSMSLLYSFKACAAIFETLIWQVLDYIYYLGFIWDFITA